MSEHILEILQLSNENPFAAPTNHSPEPTGALGFRSNQALIPQQNSPMPYPPSPAGPSATYPAYPAGAPVTPGGAPWGNATPVAPAPVSSCNCISAAALTTGISSIALFAIAPLAIIYGLVGLILGIVGIVKANKLPAHSGRAMSITSVILSVIGIAIGIFAIASFFALMAGMMNSLSQMTSDPSVLDQLKELSTPSGAPSDLPSDFPTGFPTELPTDFPTSPSDQL